MRKEFSMHSDHDDKVREAISHLINEQSRPDAVESILMLLLVLSIVVIILCLIRRKCAYLYASCGGCNKFVVYNKCINCKRNSIFKIPRLGGKNIECMTCHYTIDGQLPCPVCSTAISVQDFRGGRRSNRSDGTNVVVIGDTTPQDEQRGRSRPDERNSSGH